MLPDAAPGWADGADDGSPLDQTVDAVESGAPIDATADAASEDDARDVSVQDAPGDVLFPVDGPTESSQLSDAPSDALDAGSDTGAEAGCGSWGEPCCLPGYVCTSGLTCNGTNVMCVCATQERCGDQCVDEWSDKKNCGACGNACTWSEVCQYGQCMCPNNLTLCPGGACVSTVEDPFNCGGCGITCQSVTGGPSSQCVMGVCRIQTVVTSGTRYWSLAVDDSALYYSTASTVEALPKSGGPATVLASGLAAPARPLLVDASTIYWTAWDSTSGGVYACPLSGCAGAPTTLATITSPVADMIMDATTLYWSGQDSLQSCAKTGCGAPTTIATNLYSPNYLAVDAQNVYWDENNGNSILSCPLSGCTSPTTLVPNVWTPEGLFLDGTSFYWAASDGVHQCTLPGCVAPVTLPAYEPAQLIADSTNLYWSTTNATYVGRTPRNGGQYTVLAYAEGTPNAPQIAVDATYLYWIEQITNVIYRTAK